MRTGAVHVVASSHLVWTLRSVGVNDASNPEPADHQDPGDSLDEPALPTLELRMEHVGAVSPLTTWERSLFFAQISQIAYRDPQHSEDLFTRLGLRTRAFIDREGAQAYLLGNGSDLVVACRGTEVQERSDLKADVNALTVVAETVGRVHRGFKTEVDRIWPDIERSLGDTSDSVWFTGHSLGGAMATICAGRCYLSHIAAVPTGVYTYGAPRVGTKRYVTHTHLPHVRWVNNNDIVTRVPPAWLGYRHTGDRYYIDSDGHIRSMTKRERAKDRWKGFRESLMNRKVDHFADHAVADYVSNIAAIVERQRR